MDNGRYDLGKTIQAWSEYQDKKIKQRPDPRPAELDLEQEKALKAQIDRERAALELEVAKGNLHRQEDVDYYVSTMVANVRARIRTIPAKVTPRISGKKTWREIREIIQQEVDSALTVLSESFNPAADYDDEGGDSNSEEAEENPAR